MLWIKKETSTPAIKIYCKSCKKEMIVESIQAHRRCRDCIDINEAEHCILVFKELKPRLIKLNTMLYCDELELLDRTKRFELIGIVGQEFRDCRMIMSQVAYV